MEEGDEAKEERKEGGDRAYGGVKQGSKLLSDPREWI